MRYQFIKDHRQEYPVSLLCETLDVSISGYYAGAEASDESPKAEKMASWPNTFKPLIMPIEGYTAAHECMPNCKLRGSPVPASE